MLDVVVLSLAAFGAGALNTLAGGGTFLTFPALVLVGVPPIAANATSAVAVFPGYLGGALGYLGELRAMGRARLGRLTAVTLVGGAGGSALLLVTSDEAFAVAVPFLLLAATLVFLFGDRLRARAARAGAASEGAGLTAAGMLLVVGIYGGYFNGRLGIVLLALFALWGMTDIHRMNGLKSGLSFALSGISVAIFAAAGLVAWPQATLMMVASTAGGYAGAPLARALPRQAVRGIVVVVGFGMSAVFLVRLLV